jgi:hypothetical protein
LCKALVGILPEGLARSTGAADGGVAAGCCERLLPELLADAVRTRELSRGGIVVGNGLERLESRWVVKVGRKDLVEPERDGVARRRRRRPTRDGDGPVGRRWACSNRLGRRRRRRIAMGRRPAVAERRGLGRRHAMRDAESVGRVTVRGRATLRGRLVSQLPRLMLVLADHHSPVDLTVKETCLTASMPEPSLIQAIGTPL